MTDQVVIFWVISDSNFETMGFNNIEDAIGFAKDKNKNGYYDVIIVKKSGKKYQLVDYGYSTIYKWQNRIFNLLSIMLVAIISYLYFKFVHKK